MTIAEKYLGGQKPGNGNVIDDGYQATGDCYPMHNVKQPCHQMCGNWAGPSGAQTQGPAKGIASVTGSVLTIEPLTHKRIATWGGVVTCSDG